MISDSAARSTVEAAAGAAAAATAHPNLQDEIFNHTAIWRTATTRKFQYVAAIAAVEAAMSDSSTNGSGLSNWCQNTSILLSSLEFRQDSMPEMPLAALLKALAGNLPTAAEALAAVAAAATAAGASATAASAEAAATAAAKAPAKLSLLPPKLVIHVSTHADPRGSIVSSLAGQMQLTSLQLVLT